MVKAVLGLGIVAVVIVGIVAVVLAGTSKHTITGDLTLTDPDHTYDVDADCEGSGGYADIETGAEVTVRDGSGKTLATGELNSGSGDGTSCVFPFTLKDVPDADFYAVEVSHRGGITFSRKQLEGDHWYAGVTLGHP